MTRPNEPANVSLHRHRIIDQFTKAAHCFATAPAIRNEESLQLVLKFSQSEPSDSVLDVACGPGLVISGFAKTVRRAVGIDLTPAMIERARALEKESGLSNVCWVIGDVTTLPFAHESFSIVTSRYAFHHLEQPAVVLSEMMRVCSPNGGILLVDVVASPETERAARFNQMERLRDPSHVRALMLTEMKALFEEAGLHSTRLTFYRLEFELESLLEGSFTPPDNAQKVREMFLDSLDDDSLGIGTHRESGKIHFAYPIAVLLGTKSAEK